MFSQRKSVTFDSYAAGYPGSGVVAATGLSFGSRVAAQAKSLGHIEREALCRSRSCRIRMTAMTVPGRTARRRRLPSEPGGLPGPQHQPARAIGVGQPEPVGVDLVCDGSPLKQDGHITVKHSAWARARLHGHRQLAENDRGRIRVVARSELAAASVTAHSAACSEVEVSLRSACDR